MNSVTAFFADLHNEAVDGVAFKNLHLKKQILAYFANTGNATISELSKELNFSSPKIAELLGDLIEDGLVKDYGKAECGIGRRPNIY